MEISHLVYKRFPTLVHLKRFKKNTDAENICTVRLCFFLFESLKQVGLSPALYLYFYLYYTIMLFVWELGTVGLSPAFPSSWDSPSQLERCLPQKSHFWNQVSGCKSPWSTLLRSTRKRNASTWSDGICRSGQYSPPYRKPRNSLFSHTCSNMLNWLLYTLNGNGENLIIHPDSARTPYLCISRVLTWGNSWWDGNGLGSPQTRASVCCKLSRW